MIHNAKAWLSKLAFKRLRVKHLRVVKGSLRSYGTINKGARRTEMCKAKLRCAFRLIFRYDGVYSVKEEN